MDTSALPQEYLNRMQKLLGEDFSSFLATYSADSVRGMVVNTHKISVCDLIKLLPYNVRKLPYKDNGLQLLATAKIGGDSAHHAGLFYMQDTGAMIVADAADIGSGRRVLDMCAAPGGKSVSLALSLNEGGLLVSNEINYPRCKILMSNVERLGLDNIVTTCESPQNLAEKLPTGFFDRILVDAPCSGEGMFRKEPAAIAEWSMQNVDISAKRQREILQAADKLLCRGGYLIYSTCTYSPAENEDNVNWFLASRGYSLVMPRKEIIDCTAGDIYGGSLMRRFYPHIADGEGQFVAVMRKGGEEEEDVYAGRRAFAQVPKSEDTIVREFITKNTTDFSPEIIKQGNFFVALAKDAVPLIGVDVTNYGVRLGEIFKQRFFPHHNFFTAFGTHFNIKVNLTKGDDRINAYLRGEEIQADVADGWCCVCMEGYPLGGGKAVNGMVKNHYPKGLRLYN